MSRSRRIRSSMLSAAIAAGLFCTATAASAGKTEPAGQPASPPPVAAASPDAQTCADPAAERAKRDAALAELGRRLAAEPAVPGEFRVLNRAGHNYGEARVPAALPAQPPAKPAPKP